MSNSPARASHTGRLASLALAGGVLLWLGLFVWPLGQMLVSIALPCPPSAATETMATAQWWLLVLRSLGWASLVATCAVVLGYVPGKLVGGIFSAHSRSRQSAWLFLLLSPLLLPAYVLYYAWSLPLSPTSPLGKWLMSQPSLASGIAQALSLLAVVLWFWPLAALLLAQGWRNIDPGIMENAALDAQPWQRAWHVMLPLLRSPLLLAWSVCAALAMTEFTAFHLAGLRTAGTELSVMYDLTGSASAVVQRAWPLVLPAGGIALVLLCSPIMHASPREGLARPAGSIRSGRTLRAVVLGLLGISIIVPVCLLLQATRGIEPLRRFLAMHWDELACSSGVSAAGAVACLAISATAMALSRCGSHSRGLAMLSRVMRYTILLAMFLPPVLLASAVLEAMAGSHLPAGLRESPLVVSWGLTLRYAGAALVLMHLAMGSRDRQLAEMAAIDGASATQAWWHVHLPRLWPTLAGCFVLVGMLGMTEVPSTMILLPPGVPNFAQRLMNQMHYARDAQVIASCLVLCGVYVLLALLVAVLLKRKGGGIAVTTTLLLMLVLAGGCQKSSHSDQATCVGSFGATGTETGRFVYPRAIDVCRDGSVVVIDKLARVQRFSPSGEFIAGFAMPQSENGKPTGVSTGPGGDLYVADTHYHRVMVFASDGTLKRQWGQFGQEGGSFIYPTDVAFAGGKILVSEYGGNDRINVFDSQGHFLHSFGSPGSGPGQFARPQSMAVDEARNRLYVSDACNHRIAVYDLKACLAGANVDLPRYIGSGGTAAGQLRYPYGLAIASGGNLVVAEYGNNRVQVFDPAGRSVAVLGEAGRDMGQLAYPWAVAIGGDGILYVVDSGNNRIQRWRL